MHVAIIKDVSDVTNSLDMSHMPIAMDLSDVPSDQNVSAVRRTQDVPDVMNAQDVSHMSDFRTRNLHTSPVCCLKFTMWKKLN